MVNASSMSFTFPQLLGYCMQSDKDTSDIKSRGLTVVTELGTPVDLMAVLQMSWHQRFRVGWLDEIGKCRANGIRDWSSQNTIGNLRSTTRQTRRRGLQNKSILHAKQREWIICSPKSILNILPRSVNNATLSIFTSSGDETRWDVRAVNVYFSSVTTIVLAEL